MMNMFDAMNSVRYQLRAVGSDILSARRYRLRPFIKIIPPAGQPTASDAVTTITLYYQGQRRQVYAKPLSGCLVYWDAQD
ncbi:hypothetical protein [Arsenophonus sp. PmNCSU2021_1]|uniref:hypothetical protein n=1 Tax=Arsenophonus sp. PmNCSU2021_1 TaxID=3118989 RepID=UPI002FEF6B72